MMELNRKTARNLSRMGPRATYGLAMQDLISRNSLVYALSGDLGGSSGLSRLIADRPDHYINTGIAEQSLIGVAAGMAMEGLVPFASSFAPFITHRCADQVRMNMGYMHLNIKTVGLGSGISMGMLGCSHFGLTDLAVMGAIPGMTIFSPCDCAQLVMCVEAAAEMEGPVYIRMTGEPGMSMVYSDSFSFTPGEAPILRRGGDVLLAATGSMVHQSLAAADLLADMGIEVTVADVHTVKPLDPALLGSGEYRMVFTVEEHSVIGGLGAAVNACAVGMSQAPRVVNIGLPDSYMKAGSYQYMLQELGLTPETLAGRIADACKRFRSE